MDFNRLIDRLASLNFIGLSIKVFGMVAGLFYLVFAIVIIRQVQVMKKTVEIHDFGLLLFFSLIQLSLAIVLFIFSIFIL